MMRFGVSVRSIHLPRLAQRWTAVHPDSRRTMASTARTYEDAINALNSLQTPYAQLQARLKAGIKPDASFVHEMSVCLHRIGYTPKDLNRLNVIHVAGTKGKGSTCVFVDSILGQYRKTHNTPSRVGLFTSPHLIHVRERMCINSEPVSQDLFARCFFDVWDRLAEENHNPQFNDDIVAPGARPTYARFLTLVSWHLFLQENVDIAIYETGIGGEFDATNLVDRPIASGITSLGIDHTFALGDTIDKISWHKAGIMKHGAPAFSVRQIPAAAEVLIKRSVERSVDLQTVDIDERLRGVNLKPPTDFQRANASIAVALASTALRKLGLKEVEKGDLPREVIDGLEGSRIRGRGEVQQEGKIRWCLDGAHTADSIKLATKWFMEEEGQKSGPRVLVFNQQGRPEALDFLDSIYTASRNNPFTHVIFTTNKASASTGTDGQKQEMVNHQMDAAAIDALTVQKGFADRWISLDPEGAKVAVAPSIDDVRKIVAAEADPCVGESREVKVFITGSLHLVGAFLGVLEERRRPA